MTAQSVTVEALGARGDGIVRMGGKTVFVPGAAVGDTAWIDDGAVSRLEVGPHHAEARCSHFSACGGCSLQQLSDDHYAAWLKVPIERALEQHDLSADILPPRISPTHSRRRASLSAMRAGKRVALGFSGKRSHAIEDVRDCAVLASDIMAALPPLRAFLEETLPARRKAKIQITMASNGLDLHFDGLLVEDLEVRLAVPYLAASLNKAVRITGNDNGQTDILWQAEAPVIKMSGAMVSLPDNAFLQATKEGEAALAQTCLDWATGARSAADLFSGLGTFSFALAQNVKVDAYEGGLAAVTACRKARMAAGTHGVEAIHRDLFRRPLTPDELAAYDLVVFDPPRAGAKAQCTELAASQVDKVIAISCNPSTFARDARLLVDGGYQLQAIQPVGQFLWSTHVELAALFTR